MSKHDKKLQPKLTYKFYACITLVKAFQVVKKLDDELCNEKARQLALSPTLEAKKKIKNPNVALVGDVASTKVLSQHHTIGGKSKGFKKAKPSSNTRKFPNPLKYNKTKEFEAPKK